MVITKTLDVKLAGSQWVTEALKGEADARTLHIGFESEGSSLSLDGVAHAYLYARKPSGQYTLINACTINDDDTIDYVETAQTCAEQGRMLCTLVLVDEDGATLYSPQFTIHIFPNELDQSGIVSASEFTAINEQVASADDSRKRAEAWAVGTMDGEPVDEEDETYHNNSKYYAEQGGGGSGTTYTAGTGIAISNNEISINTSGASTGQVLKKTSNGVGWANESGGSSYTPGTGISISGNAIAINTSGASTGQVLKKTANGVGWADESSVNWAEPIQMQGKTFVGKDTFSAGYHELNCPEFTGLNGSDYKKITWDGYELIYELSNGGTRVAYNTSTGWNSTYTEVKNIEFLTCTLTKYDYEWLKTIFNEVG